MVDKPPARAASSIKKPRSTSKKTPQHTQRSLLSFFTPMTDVAATLEAWSPPDSDGVNSKTSVLVRAVESVDCVDLRPLQSVIAGPVSRTLCILRTEC